MSYIIFNNSIKYGDSANIDAFGRLRVSAQTNLIDIKHVLDKNPLFVSEVIGGGASSNLQKDFARVRMTTSTNGDYVIRQSKLHPIYQPGKSQVLEASFSNFQLETNVIKRIGGFTSTTAATYNSIFDGFFIESNGVNNEISFQIHRSGTTIFSATSDTWNSNEFDPLTINWENTQILFVDYQWLGVGRMRFGLNINGRIYYFAEHVCANNEPEVYMAVPNQPIRYEIRQLGIGSGYLDMICSQASFENDTIGLYSSIGIPHSTTTTLVNSGTKYPYIGYRLNPDSKSVTSQFSNLSILNTSNDNYLITIEFNPTLSSTPTWTDATNTPIQYSLGTGAATVTSSGYIISNLIGQSGTAGLTTVKLDNNQMRVGSNIDGTLDEMWICITPLGANATFNGSVDVIYYK